MTDLFQKMIASRMVYLVFLTLLACTPSPQFYKKNIVSHWFELIHLSPLKNKPFKTLSIGTTKTCFLIVPCSNILPIILDEAVEGLDDENVALVPRLLPFYHKKQIW
jgi:ABC-type molybdenum transport system ATPase subunit/photorepair protein PhrA